MSHDDVRRSLEVLDSVLAEFDDCVDSWDSFATSPAECKFSESIPELRRKFEQTEDRPHSGKLSNGLSRSQGRLPLEKFTLDGVTSHNSTNSAAEQPKVISPPPIPKRSPTTKLSERNQQQDQRFTFPTSSDDTSLEDCFDDEGPLSQQQITTTLSAKNGDAGPRCDKFTSDKCSNCGRGLKAAGVMEAPSIPSPFMQKRQVFEPKAVRELSPGPSVARSRSFKVKRMVAEIMDGSSSEPCSLPADISFESSCSVRDCTCRDRIRHLNEKFAETKRLLRLKKIKVLDSEPPSFVPPPPGGDAVVPKTDSHLDDTEERSLYYSADVSNNVSSSQNEEDSLLCNRCSNALATHLNETIEDIPNLLPTDALNRPHLGFSYSMEEDLPPGVKEIQMTTSTPKSGVSQPSLFRTKESNLSTFSQSVSSLGYVSSQSDLELNNISSVPDKVPVSTFKSMTLPNGLERSPFYSASEDDHQGTDQKSWQNDHNDNRVRKSSHMSVEELRSSSAQEEEKPKKKHFRGFSRKSKKDKKNDDNLSLTSDASTDEGVILKKLSTLDGSSIDFDAALADDKTGGGVEKKRWSLLRSIIGKKSP